MHTALISNVILFLFLISTTDGATAVDVISANANLLSQTDNIDIAVVAITAQTPPTTAQVSAYLINSIWRHGVINLTPLQIPASPTIASISHKCHLCRTIIPDSNNTNLGSTNRNECSPLMGAVREHRRGING